MKKTEVVADWRKSRISGHKQFANEEHSQINQLCERICRGMTHDEISQVTTLVEKLRDVINSKFQRKEVQISEAQTVKEVVRNVWYA